ncbi:MAG TPA: hypothetical protein VMY35_10430 [Phycisphaerae bacterium]|nr:hypothetical protein [Phycisphaerae bacterium]
MKITQIIVEGARGWATILRSGLDVMVNWEVSTGSPRQGSWVISPGDWRGQGGWAWAARLHRQLEGSDGCAGDVAPYRLALEHFFG